MQNRYSFGIHTDLPPIELFFFIAIDGTMKELGIDEVVGVAMILSGQRFVLREVNLPAQSRAPRMRQFGLAAFCLTS